MTFSEDSFWHKRFPTYFSAFRAGQSIFLGAAVGVIAGLGAILFNFLVFGSLDIFFVKILGWGVEKVSEDASVLIPAEGLRYWLMPLMVAFGGLMSGLLVFTFAPEAEGHGTDAFIRAFHRKRGIIRGRVPIIKTIASAITIGTGGSAGREGPIAQIGAGFGSWLGQMMGLEPKQLRSLIIAGTAGGIGAVFCAPLGGAMFAIEVLYRKQDMETESLIPAVVSSLVAFSIFTTLTGQTQVFHTMEFTFKAWELLPYAMLGLICSLIGILYVNVFYGARDYFFKKIPLPLHVLPMIGGLMTGALALYEPAILSGGYGWIERAMSGDLAIRFMFSLVFLKMIATAFTISSGGSGGVFGPSLFIGAMLGASFGFSFDQVFPGWISDPRSFALVGMVAFFSGIAKVPVASLLMVSEMAQTYELLVPMMLVSSLTYILTDKWSLYEEQVPGKAESPAHIGEYRTDVLEGLRVHEIDLRQNWLQFPHHMTLRQMLPQILQTSQNLFPVTFRDGQIKAVLSLEDVRAVMLEEQIYDLVVADDIAEFEFASVSPDDDLHFVMSRLTELNEDEISVYDKQNDRYVGIISRRDILNLYNRRLHDFREDE
ncbi:MAG: chloride channel protein [Candidatus Hinthialibacter antarcticus]|nr:chloride channel protein [Candidatus Hinthialibacter antarcticus]